MLARNITIQNTKPTTISFLKFYADGEEYSAPTISQNNFGRSARAHWHCIHTHTNEIIEYELPIQLSELMVEK